MNLILPHNISAGFFNSDIAIKNKTITEERMTDMFEIDLPIEPGGVSHVNAGKAVIKPGTIICAKPGQMRHTKLPLKCYYIHMSVSNGILYDSLMNIPDFIKTNEYEKYFMMFRKIYTHYESAIKSDSIIFHSVVLELIYNLIDDSKKMTLKVGNKQTNIEAVAKAEKYINENLTSPLLLENIAKHAGFSPIHFHNFFKASTGKTPREYIEEKRIKKAAAMLITTNCTLAEIAYECGFSSQSYFSYAFKRKMNKTPREYAKDIFEQYES